MKYTYICGNKCEKSSYFMPELSAACSWDFQFNKMFKKTVTQVLRGSIVLCGNFF